MADTDPLKRKVSLASSSPKHRRKSTPEPYDLKQRQRAAQPREFFFMGRAQRKHKNNSAFRRDLHLYNPRLKPMPKVALVENIKEEEEEAEKEEEQLDHMEIALDLTPAFAGLSHALRYIMDDEAPQRFLAHRPIRLPRDTQVTGASFMEQRMMGMSPPHDVRGGLYLDGMRMGKTQAVSMMILNMRQKRVAAGLPRFGRTAKPTLVLGPKEVVTVWPREINDSIGPDVLVVLAFDTEDLPLLEDQYGGEQLKKMLREETDIIVTSYSFLSLTHENWLAQFLLQGDYDIVVYDEAHNISNEKTVGYRVLMPVKADSKWYISGTPISNDLESLRTALALVGVNPRLLATTLKDDAALKEYARPLWIRRTLTIPEAINACYIDWSNRAERRLYQQIVQVFCRAVIQGRKKKSNQSAIGRLNMLASLPPVEEEENDVNEEEEEVDPHLFPNDELPLDYGDVGGQTELRLLQLLRRFCLSPYLVQSLFSTDAKAGQEHILLPPNVMFFPWRLEEAFLPDTIEEEVSSDDDDDAMSLASTHSKDDTAPSRHPLLTKHLMQMMILDALGILDAANTAVLQQHPLRDIVVPPVSPKECWFFRTLLSDYTDLRQEKPIVFSNFRRPLERIAFLLDLRLRLGVPHARGYAHVHGNLKKQEREAERSRFFNDPQCGVLLAIIDIYKEVIDLTAANHVVLYDPWWNPQPELQAVSRIIGPKQTLKTYRYRLLMQGSVDEVVANVADEKIGVDLNTLPPTRVGPEERALTNRVWEGISGKL